MFPFKKTDNSLKKPVFQLVAVGLLLCLLCVGTFASLAYFLNHRGSDTIAAVGTMYMSGLSERLTKHFQSTLDYQFDQLEAIIAEVPPEENNSTVLLRQRLEEAGLQHELPVLLLCGPEGWLDAVYGQQVFFAAPNTFLNALNRGQKWAAMARTADGSQLLLLGLPAHYVMEDGTPASGLLAGIPLDKVREVLDADYDNLQIITNIIWRDGSYAVDPEEFNLSLNGKSVSFFEHIFDSANADNPAAGQYVRELYSAMQRGESYSALLEQKLQRLHLYCTPLPYTDWYLAMVMPYGKLDETVNLLSRDCLAMACAGCLVMFLGLGLLFVCYTRVMRQQLRLLQQTREAAEAANRAKSDFLSSMSHDIRTPMNAIVGLTAIAEANVNNPSQLQNCLRNISLSSKHLLGLINDVLDMSKIESGKLTMNISQVSLREVMDSMVSIVQPQIRAKRQHFNVNIQNITVENVCCDGVRLNQVLLNFLSNAIKFTPEGGTISLTMSQEPSPKGEDQVRVQLWVADTGYGMSEEFQRHIFDSFSRENNERVHKTEGSGLGMTITKYIIDVMGGSLTVKSAPGQGTTFHVTLDLPIAAMQEADMLLPAWRMLVVDDDPLLCQSALASLQAIGVQAESVLDGESALRLILQRRQQGLDYEIILLDWQLPGMNGIETAREIRRILADNVPILLISAYDWGEIEDDARAAGINGFIGKPLFKSTLYYGLRPYAPELPGAEPAQEPAAPLDLTDRRVLVAEDNSLNWEIAEALLAELGLLLEWAENGQICLEMFQQSAVGYYDAILMDLRMPVMNGYDAAQQIRALPREDAATIPIIAMSADAFYEDVQRCLDCGMNAHTAKPIDVQDVAAQLTKYIGQRQAE